MKLTCPKCTAGYLAHRHRACPWCDRAEAARTWRDGYGPPGPERAKATAPATVGKTSSLFGRRAEK